MRTFQIEIWKILETLDGRGLVITDRKLINKGLDFFNKSQNNGYEEQYGEGTQWYFSKQLARKLSQQEKTPYVSREVVI